MGHQLKLNRAHSPLNQRILSSTFVPFTLTMVQVTNLALTLKKRLTVQMGDCLMVDALLVADEGWVMVLVTDCRLMVVGS
jgi:hypothetical protein